MHSQFYQGFLRPCNFAKRFCSQTNRHQIQYEPLSEQQKFDIRKQVRQYLQNEIDEIEVNLNCCFVRFLKYYFAVSCWLKSNFLILQIINVRQLHGVFDAMKSVFKQAQSDYEVINVAISLVPVSDDF